MTDITNKTNYRTLNRAAEKGQGSCKDCLNKMNFYQGFDFFCTVRKVGVKKNKTCDRMTWAHPGKGKR
jgi:hypothetical protein